MNLDSRLPKVLGLTLLLFLMGLAFGQVHEHGLHDSTAEQLGKVSFPISCPAPVQGDFTTGVAALHSFEYPLAMQHFQNVVAHDPSCAMGYWGEAMALYHQLWDPPSAQDLTDGWRYVQQAQKATETSPREREYIQAMAAYYQPVKEDSEARATAYSKQMGTLHGNYPSDEEATVFYALSLLAAEPPSDTSLEWAKKAVRILNGVLASDPQHPGVAHYLIHACDNPKMAQEGLAAARRYASIAPASPHALHMPSHIFARLGLWQDDISSNRAAVSAAEKPGIGTEQRLHPMDFLEYAYLQTGQDGKARAIEVEAVATKNEGFSHGLEPYYFYVQAHFPALLALETRNWKAAEALQPKPGAEPGSRAITYRAQAIGAARSGDVVAAGVAVKNLDEAQAEWRKLHPDYPVPPVDTNKNEADAWLAFAQRNSAQAFDLLKPVIQFQDSVGKGEVELPAREMYADMLLELNRPAEALEQYELSLKSDPNRFNGLYGAGRSAELAHQDEVARDYYKQLLENCALGNGSDRPELIHAKEFMARFSRQQAAR